MFSSLFLYFFYSSLKDHGHEIEHCSGAGLFVMRLETGQDALQSWHTTQSSVRLTGTPVTALKEGLTPVGHALSHTSQERHASLGTFTFQKER